MCLSLFLLSSLLFLKASLPSVMISVSVLCCPVVVQRYLGSGPSATRLQHPCSSPRGLLAKSRQVFFKSVSYHLAGLIKRIYMFGLLKEEKNQTCRPISCLLVICMVSVAAFAPTPSENTELTGQHHQGQQNYWAI